MDNSAAQAGTSPDELLLFGLSSDDDAWFERFQRADARQPIGRLGEYEILGQIGSGGQGVVYRARQPGTGRDVAVKRLRAGTLADADARRRFQREIAAAAALRHANIVRVFGVEALDGQPHLVMEWIDGAPLTAWAARLECSRAGLAERLKTFARVCDAVHHAHQRGIIHRDLKPSNILVDAEGEPHVLDFGLAVATTSEIRRGGEDTEGTERSAASLGRSTRFAGTLAYAAPEQFDGGAGAGVGVDVRTDVYALGVILFELLAGTLPYTVDGSLADAISAIQSEDPAAPSRCGGVGNAETDAIVLKALAKEPPRRYQSVDALYDDVQRYLAGERVLAHPSDTLYVLRKLARRHRAAVTFAAVIVFLSVAFGMTATWLALRVREQQRATARARDEESHARRIAERVSAFLKDTLGSAGPARHGADTTLLEMLRDAGRRAESELRDEPEVAAEVYFTIGRTFRSLWMGEATPYLRRAAELKRQQFGDNHEELARCLTVLGTALSNQRDPQAVDLQREALAIRLRLFGPESVLTAESQMRLAYALFRIPPARWDEAERLFDQSLDTYRRLLGPVHRDVACCLHNYGYMRLEQARTHDADRLYSEALDILRTLGNLDDPYYVECLHGYTGMLRYVGRNEECASVLPDLIPRVQRAYGTAATFTLLRRYGNACLALRRIDDAWRHFLSALAVKCDQLAKDVPEQAANLTRLAELSRSDADRGGADPRIADWLAALDGPPHKPQRELIECVQSLAVCLRERGETSAATGLLEQLLAARRALVEGADAAVCGLLEGLADAALGEGDPARAAALLDECVQQRGQLDQPGEAATAASKLGEAFHRLGRFDEAETFLLNSLATLERLHGDALEPLRAPLQRLATLYEATGQSEQAERYRARLASQPPQ